MNADNCKSCRFISSLSDMGYRYCVHPNRSGESTYKIYDVRNTPDFCPKTHRKVRDFQGELLAEMKEVIKKYENK